MRWRDFAEGDRVEVAVRFAHHAGKRGVVEALLDFGTESDDDGRVHVRFDDGTLLDMMGEALRPLDVIERIAELA